MDEEELICHPIKRNKDKKPLCDWKDCTNLAYREVYPKLMGKKGGGWCYLCRKHFEAEKKRLGNKLVYCGME